MKVNFRQFDGVALRALGWSTFLVFNSKGQLARMEGQYIVFWFEGFSQLYCPTGRTRISSSFFTLFPFHFIARPGGKQFDLIYLLYHNRFKSHQT
jgi:hypothetical protein